MSEHNRTAYFSNPCLVATAAVLAFLAVALGAFGAHGLKDMLEASGKAETWQTAADYQFWHALALLALGLAPVKGRAITVAAAFFVLGVLLFSGSLYWLCLSGLRWLGPITPLGGICFLVGWGILAVIAVKSALKD
ncbi:DUF423 domain-containing protein [Cerasicoccus frondis]|uniref:DUF423 domain-containing protein n=1 Tax=Cerasicoccus frondis TaxID=490090 RepID=UPI002852546C|nr:DUF423 domain-containing protein [Cerasicoccus frondis]